MEVSGPTSWARFDSLSQEMDDVSGAISALEVSVVASHSSRKTTYILHNPDFTVDDLYLTHFFYNDLHRTSFTKLRVNGHN